MSEVLLDRQAELDAISAAVSAAARGQGSALLIEGSAGIGKTALMRAGRRIAADGGLAALTARGAELERNFGFGVVRQLFDPLVDEGGTIEQAVTGRALPVSALLEVGESDGSPPLAGGAEATYGMLNALYWLTVNLAQGAPLVLAIDDAHWADPASRRYLSYLTGRLEKLPVLLMVASRPAGESDGRSAEPILLAADVTALHPRPLGEMATAELVRGAIADAPDELCDACRTASGGNPFLLRELIDTLRDRGPTAADAVADLVPQGVAAAVRSRINRLAPPAWAMAHAVAVLGDGAALRHAASAAELDPRAAAGAADALVAAGILAPGRPLRFTHPLIRGAVYEELPLGERAAPHARVAWMLAAEEVSFERIAAHLLVSEPCRDGRVSEQLRAAARDGMRRGAPEAAVIYLRRALEEPPPEEARAELLIELGEAEAITPDSASAVEHLAHGIATVRHPEQRLHAALLLAGILGIDGRSLEGVSVLEQALAESPDAEPALRERIEAHLVNIGRFDLVTRRRVAAAAARTRERVRGGQIGGGVELAAAAAEEAMAGDSADRTGELAQLALARLAEERPSLADYNLYMAVRCLLVADRFDLARRFLDAAVEQAREQGAAVPAAVALSFRSELHYRIGALAAAHVDGEAALRTARAGWRVGMPAGAAILAMVLVELGDLDAAQRTIEAGGVRGPAGSVGTSYPVTMLLHARGELQLMRGDAPAALEDLVEVGRRQEIMGEPNPALVNWRSPAALALATLGRRGEALSLADENVALARRFGAPRALGLALQAAGVIGGSDVGLDHLHEAQAVLAHSPARLAHAHALAHLGAAQRARGDHTAAREALSRALDVAHACGALALENRTLGQLHALGARPRRPSQGVAALTPGERRAAVLASQGLSNREIAEALVVTVRTVEFHLGHAFKKLGIQSRGELAHQFAGDRQPPAA